MHKARVPSIIQTEIRSRNETQSSGHSLSPLFYPGSSNSYFDEIIQFLLIFFQMSELKAEEVMGYQKCTAH